MGPDVSSHVRDAGSGWSLRSVAVALRGGGHAVLAAGRAMDPGALEPRFLVATNHFHWMGIPEWRARFPNVAWLDVRGTWFVCDAFFNEPNIAPGVKGIGLRLTQTTPGLRIGQTWKYLQLAKVAEYRSWLLATLERSPPKRVVPAHGDPIEGDDLGSRLAHLVRARL